MTFYNSEQHIYLQYPDVFVYPEDNISFFIKKGKPMSNTDSGPKLLKIPS